MSWLPSKYSACSMNSLSNFSHYETHTNFTPAQFMDFVQRYLDFACFTSEVLSLAGAISFIVSGVVGLVSYVFMFGTLHQLSISDCTLIYYMGTVAMELPHMMIMIQHGILSLAKDNIANSWAWVFWKDQTIDAWLLGDGLKLATSTLSTFVAWERCVAVCFPIHFPMINQRRVAYFAIACSLLIGTAHLWPFFATRVVYDHTKTAYIKIPTAFADNAFYKFTVYFTYSAKGSISAFVCLLSVATYVRLRSEQKKLATMSSDAKKEWVTKRRICALAFILAGSVVLDNTVWIFHKIVYRALTDIGVENVIRRMDYKSAMGYLLKKRVSSASELSQRLGGQLVHSWRFVIYLTLNKTMRNGFRKLFARTAVSPSRKGNIVTTKV